MATDSFFNLLSVLADRTAAGRAKWTVGSRDDTFLWSGSAGSVVMLSDDNDGFQPYVVRLVDKDGRVIEEENFSRDEWGNESERLDLIMRLYQMARANALDIDRTIDSLLEDLGGDGF